jgi:hypothetical protein
MCCTTVIIYNISPEEHGSWTYLCWIVLYWRGNLSTTLAFPDMSVQTKLNQILHSPDEITKTENLKGSYSNSSWVKGWKRTFLSMQFLTSFNSVLHLWYSVLQILNKICILHVRIMYTNERISENRMHYKITHQICQPIAISKNRLLAWVFIDFLQKYMKICKQQIIKHNQITHTLHIK